MVARVLQFDTASQNKYRCKRMNITKIQSALQSLKEERAHIEEYLQNAAVKKKELEKNRNVHLIHIIVINNKKHILCQYLKTKCS